jgi:fatty acid-binding protein DegV
MMADYQARLAVDSHLAETVRVADSASVKSCVRIQQLETAGEALDTNQSTREIRLRSQAAQLRADAIVFTTPPAWTGRVKGEAYRCPPPVTPELPGTSR